MGTEPVVVGVGLSDLGRVEVSAFELHHQAAARALADAGLTPRDVDGIGSTGTGLLPPVELSEFLGLTPTWIDSTTVGGAAWLVMLQHAAAALRAGDASVVLLTYANTPRRDVRSGRRRADVAFVSDGPSAVDASTGHTLASRYAMAATRYLHEFGATIEHLAEVAVSARYNASLTPEAFVRSPLTIEEVQAAPMVAEPFTSLHCCLRTDGGGAIVLTTADRAADLPSRPIRVLGAASAIGPASMASWRDFTSTPASRSGPLAFRRAGVEPGDIDVAQLYDAFTISVPLTLEALGFCGTGEGAAFAATGALRVGGALPTNTDGGGLSHSHPGQRGIFLVIEAVRQLRGDAGDRQVPGAQLACAHGTGGWFSSAATVVLGTADA